jgi:hypothetical protein
MKVKLVVGELKELNRQAPMSAQGGGFQNFIVQLQYRTDEDTGELELSSEDLERIQRYAFGYKGGGWQNRLLKIFGRTLGPNLDGSL